MVFRGIRRVSIQLKCILIVDFLILRNPLAKVSHRTLYMFDSANCLRVIVVKLVLCYEVGCRCLRYMHFLVQMFNLSGAVSHGFVEERSIRCDVPIRGEVATKWWHFLYKGPYIVRDWYKSVVPEFGSDSLEHDLEIE